MSRLLITPDPSLPGDDRDDGYIVAVTYRFTAMGAEWIIPCGFQTDGASIPTLFGLTWVVTYSKFHPCVMRAAVEHDWFCRVQPAGSDYKRAAARFEQVVIEDGGNATRAAMMHRAILIGGPKWGEA